MSNDILWFPMYAIRPSHLERKLAKSSPVFCKMDVMMSMTSAESRYTAWQEAGMHPYAHCELDGTYTTLSLGRRSGPCT